MKIEKSPAGLYISRKVKNPEEIMEYVSKIGIGIPIPKNDMHVTIIFSKTPVDTTKCLPDENDLTVNIFSKPILYGPGLVLGIEPHNILGSHQRYLAIGATHDFEDGDYFPHVTLKYDPSPEEIELCLSVPAAQFELQLSEEIQEDLVLNWRPNTE